MDDVFREQLVKRKQGAREILIKAVGLLTVFIIFTVVRIFMIELLVFILIGVGYLYYFLICRLRVEYEYIMTNGELDIDIIYNKSKRKRVFSIDLKSVPIFSRVGDTSHEEHFSGTIKLDCSSGQLSPNSCMFPAVVNGKKRRVIIEPNQKMMDAMSPYLGVRKQL